MRDIDLVISLQDNKLHMESSQRSIGRAHDNEAARFVITRPEEYANDDLILTFKIDDQEPFEENIGTLNEHQVYGAHTAGASLKVQAAFWRDGSRLEHTDDLIFSVYAGISTGNTPPASYQEQIDGIRTTAAFGITAVDSTLSLTNQSGEVVSQAELSIPEQSGPGFVLDPRINNGAITLWISPDGDDETGDGSEENPYRTIGHTANVYNGFVGVSYCDIRLMDGIYTLDSSVVFRIRGSLSFKGASMNRDNVVIQEGGLVFDGGTLYASYFTVNVSTDACGPYCITIRCKASCNNLKFFGNKNLVCGIAVGIGVLAVISSEFQNCKYAVYSEWGSSCGVFGCTGSGNSYAFVTAFASMFLAGNAISATTQKHYVAGGQIWG